MMKVLYLRFFVAAWLLCSGASITKASDLPLTIRVSGAVNQRLIAAPDSSESGNGIHLTVTLHNNTNQPMSVGITTIGPAMTNKVRLWYLDDPLWNIWSREDRNPDPIGKPVKLTSLGRQLYGTDRADYRYSVMDAGMPPGGDFSEDLDLSLIYKINRLGRYAVRVDREYPDNSHQYIQSNVLVFTVSK